MAAYVPRTTRTARLWYLPPDTVIGWRAQPEPGRNTIYDLVMLPEKEFIRARMHLGLENPNAVGLTMTKMTAAFVPQYVQEVSVPPTEPEPRAYARRYFRAAFGLDSAWEEAAASVGATAHATPSGAATEDDLFRRVHGHSDPYAILGVSREGTDAAIKRAYRLLIRSYHPDRLASEPGMTPARLARVSEMVKRLNAAYDDIRAERGMR